MLSPFQNQMFCCSVHFWKLILNSIYIPCSLMEISTMELPKTWVNIVGSRYTLFYLIIINKLSSRQRVSNVNTIFVFLIGGVTVHSIRMCFSYVCQKCSQPPVARKIPNFSQKNSWRQEKLRIEFKVTYISITNICIFKEMLSQKETF